MIQRKGRYRENRGKLTSFDGLPEYAQENFNIIKNELKVDTYVYGSFYWGFWDDKSDYDVFTDIPLDNRPELEQMFKDKYKLDVNIMPPTNITDKILIP